MTWAEFLATVLPILAALLAALAPFLIQWLRNQKLVQAAKVDDLLESATWNAVEWVEWWATGIYEKQFGRKPDSDVKLQKAFEFIRKIVPVSVSDELLRMHVENTLARKEKMDANTGTGS